MPDRTMRTALSIAALTVLAWSSAPSPHAEAQAFSSNATITINGDKIKNNSNVYIDRTECSGDWIFQLQGYSTNVPYLEMWATNNVNTNCADQANRTSATNTATICWQITGPQRNVNPKATFVVKGAQIFNAEKRDAAVVAAGGRCDDGINGLKYKVQFVTLDSPTTPNTATVNASNGNANQISAILTLYSAIPAAPLNPKGIPGGRTLGISYSKIDNQVLTEYRAYYDHDPDAPVVLGEMDGGVDGGAISCGSGAFDDIKLPDGGVTQRTGAEVTLGENVFRSSSTKGSKVSIGDLDEKGIGLNTYTAVAVAAVDGAGNAGYLSAPICVKRQNTETYLGACRDAGADCGDLESCNLSSSRHRNTGSALALSACTLAISAWTRRRRRST